MNEHEIAKGLEVWVLQNLVNFSILLGLFASGLILAQAYFRQLERHLSLRVSTELWRLGTVAAADVLLAVVALIGYAVLNPDIMADIKIAVPFYPVATLLFTAALVLRLFRGGHEPSSANFSRALHLTLAANVLNTLGFTFVAEAPGQEYLSLHASPFWTFLKTHLRSNANPAGLELSHTTFLICFPLLLVLVAWAVQSALRGLRVPETEE